jgi:hypothetical protein
MLSYNKGTDKVKKQIICNKLSLGNNSVIMLYIVNVTQFVHSLRSSR